MLQDACCLLDRDDADLQLAGKGLQRTNLLAGRCSEDAPAQGVGGMADDLPLADRRFGQVILLDEAYMN